MIHTTYSMVKYFNLIILSNSLFQAYIGSYFSSMIQKIVDGAQQGYYKEYILTTFNAANATSRNLINIFNVFLIFYGACKRPRSKSPEIQKRAFRFHKQFLAMNVKTEKFLDGASFKNASALQFRYIS